MSSSAGWRPRRSFRVEWEFHCTNFYPNRKSVAVWEAALQGHFVLPVSSLDIWPLAVITVTRALGDSVLSIHLPLSRGKMISLPVTCVTDSLRVENTRVLLPDSCVLCRTPCTCWWFCWPARKPLAPSASWSTLTATQCLSPLHTWIPDSLELLLIARLFDFHSFTMFQLSVVPELIHWNLIPKGQHWEVETFGSGSV